MILTAKAFFFAKELGCNDFHVSDGWLDRWKKRKNVSVKYQVYTTKINILKVLFKLFN